MIHHETYNSIKTKKDTSCINYQCCIWKKNGKLKNRTDVKLLSNKKDYLKWTSKPRVMSHKIFDNDLIAILKNKLTLMLSKQI